MRDKRKRKIKKRKEKKDLSFTKWLSVFEDVLADDLMHHNKVYPRATLSTRRIDIEQKTLQKYGLYINELQTMKLIKATWFLAFGTIILSIVSLIFNLIH